MRVRPIRLALLLLGVVLASVALATAQSPVDAPLTAPLAARRIDVVSGDRFSGERIQDGHALPSWRHGRDVAEVVTKPGLHGNLRLIGVTRSGDPHVADAMVRSEFGRRAGGAEAERETATPAAAVGRADAARPTVTNPGLIKAMRLSVREKSVLPTEPAFAAAQEKFPVPPEVRAEFRRMYEEANDLYATYHAKVQAAQNALGGQAIIAPLKEPMRAQEKLLEGIVTEVAPRESVKDILRSTVVVIDQDEVQVAIDAVMAQFPGAKVKRNLLVPGSTGLGETGYRDVLINAPMGDLVVEVQVNFPEMIDLKEGPGHALYEVQREITDLVKRESREGNETPTELAEIARLDREQFAVYNPPWLAFNRRRASSASMGSPSDSAIDRSAGLVDPSGRSLQADAPRTATITGAENPVSKNSQGALPATSGRGSCERRRDFIGVTDF